MEDILDLFKTKDNLGNTTEIKLSWCIEDVYHAAENCTFGSTLTDIEAGQVLDYVLKNHDCNNGVTWETLEYAIDNIISERSK